MWPGAAPLTVPSSAVAQRACAGCITYRIFSGGHVLTYPIPGPDGAVLCNWLWYRNLSPGLELTDLLTDRNGFTAELTVPPGSVQDWHRPAACGGGH